jgi:hypothetical protein
MRVDNVYALFSSVPWPWLRLGQVHGFGFFVTKSDDAAFPGDGVHPEFIDFGLVGAAVLGVPPKNIVLVEGCRDCDLSVFGWINRVELTYCTPKMTRSEVCAFHSPRSGLKPGKQ